MKSCGKRKDFSACIASIIMFNCKFCLLRSGFIIVFEKSSPMVEIFSLHLRPWQMYALPHVQMPSSSIFRCLRCRNKRAVHHLWPCRKSICTTSKIHTYAIHSMLTKTQYQIGKLYWFSSYTSFIHLNGKYLIFIHD